MLEKGVKPLTGPEGRKKKNSPVDCKGPYTSKSCGVALENEDKAGPPKVPGEGGGPANPRGRRIKEADPTIQELLREMARSFKLEG